MEKAESHLPGSFVRRHQTSAAEKASGAVMEDRFWEASGELRGGAAWGGRKPTEKCTPSAAGSPLTPKHSS
ncbi:Glutamate--tRNA ligase [Trichinella spiralis]|uniref:Glutamate--tRNA ligase n=1 Tax=Trichinella spiralis TaxID=6334 RepID=A0ABR3K3S5_TRISP